MGKHKGYLLFVTFMYTCVTFLGACASSKKAQIKPVVTDEPVILQLRGLQGREEVASYRSHSIVKTYEKKQLIKEKEEVVDFAVKTETVLVDRNKARLHMLVSTIRKNGPVDLHDMAFPELNEVIPVVFYPNAEVISVGDFPKSSVFYVPPISLPNREVKVGDTWELSRAWISDKNALPLQIDMVTIFKALIPCGGAGLCADLEVSGKVSIPGQTEEGGLDLKSHIFGRVLFSLHKGSVVWSQVNSKESLSYGETKIDIISCLASAIESPKEERWPYSKDNKCDPKISKIIGVPGVATVKSR